MLLLAGSISLVVPTDDTKLYRVYLTEHGSYVDYGIWTFTTHPASGDSIHAKDDKRLNCGGKFSDDDIDTGISALFLGFNPEGDCRMFKKHMCGNSQAMSIFMLLSSIATGGLGVYIFLQRMQMAEPEYAELIYLAFMVVFIMAAWDIERYVSIQVFHDVEQQTQCGSDTSRAIPGVHAPDMRPMYNGLLFGLCVVPTLAFLGFLADRAIHSGKPAFYTALHQLWF